MAGLETTRRTHTQTSASQIKNFEDCERLWFFRSILGIPSPQTPSQALGEHIHAGSELYLLEGEVPKGIREIKKRNKLVKVNFDPVIPYVQAAAKILPPPQTPELLVEHEIRFKLPQGITFLGYIDFGESDRDALLLGDLKTTSNLRYAKTPKELFEDTQMISYGQWAYQEAGHKGEIDLSHFYVQTYPEGKLPKNKLPNVFGPVSAIVTESHVQKHWSGILKTVDRMLETSLASSVEDVAPTGSKKYPKVCDKYGGCAFRSKCGLEKTVNLFGNLNKGKPVAMNDFLKKLKAKKEAQAAEAPAPKKAKGILPPDAPSRTYRETVSTEEAVEFIKNQKEVAEVEAAPAPKKRGRPPKAETREKIQAAARAVEAEDSDEETEKPAVRKQKGNRKPFNLYIDCQPVKGNANGLPPTLFEDWFAPIEQSMNEFVKEEKNLDNFRFLPFSEEKALLFGAIQSRMEKDLPEEMIVSSSGPAARDALGVLIPHATQVYRAFRA